MATDYKILGDAIALPFSGRSAPSRFMKSAMTERLSSVCAATQSPRRHR